MFLFPLSYSNILCLCCELYAWAHIYCWLHRFHALEIQPFSSHSGCFSALIKSLQRSCFFFFLCDNSVKISQPIECQMYCWPMKWSLPPCLCVSSVLYMSSALYHQVVVGTVVMLILLETKPPGRVPVSKPNFVVAKPCTMLQDALGPKMTFSP